MGHYAGIGSRSTPANILQLMERLASKLEFEGWVLRSGGADGADSSFERGVKESKNKQIFLPSSYFNGRSAKSSGNYDACSLPSFAQASITVDKYHPAPHRLSDFARKLMARNAMQVLGPDLQTFSSFVIAWTPRGRREGGTSQALRIALDYSIPVFNLGIAETQSSLTAWADNDTEKTFQELFLSKQP